MSGETGRPTRGASALWSKIEKNTDVRNGPLARPFARGEVNDQIAILSVIFPIFDHSAAGEPIGEDPSGRQICGEVGENLSEWLD